jgi:hypothetical protein
MEEEEEEEGEGEGEDEEEARYRAETGLSVCMYMRSGITTIFGGVTFSFIF